MILLKFILPLLLIINHNSVLGQKCKNLKDELDPFTNKRIIMSKGFSLSAIEIDNTKPQINGQFIFENDITFLQLASSIIFAGGGLSSPTERSKDLVDIKLNDYISFKFEGLEKIIKKYPMQESKSTEQMVSGTYYLHSYSKYVFTKDELMMFALNKIERIRISKNNENNNFDYQMVSDNKKEKVITDTRCFISALNN